MYEKFNRTTNARRSNKRWPTFEIISIDPSPCKLTPSTKKEKNIHPHPNARILLATLNFSHHISSPLPAQLERSDKESYVPRKRKDNRPGWQRKIAFHSDSKLSATYYASLSLVGKGQRRQDPDSVVATVLATRWAAWADLLNRSNAKSIQDAVLAHRVCTVCLFFLFLSSPFSLARSRRG